MVSDGKKTWVRTIKYWSKLPTVSALKELTVYETRRGRKCKKINAAGGIVVHIRF